MKLILMTLCVVGLGGIANASLADDDRGSRRGPPEAAFAACEGLEAEATCSIVRRDGGVIAGRCLTPPRLDRVVCVPDNHREGDSERERPRDEGSDRL